MLNPWPVCAHSSSAMWGVLGAIIFVWWLGHWVQSREQHLDQGVLRWRLAGATTMIAAIALVLI